MWNQLQVKFTFKGIIYIYMLNDEWKPKEHEWAYKKKQKQKDKININTSFVILKKNEWKKPGRTSTSISV